MSGLKTFVVRVGSVLLAMMLCFLPFFAFTIFGISPVSLVSGQYVSALLIPRNPFAILYVAGVFWLEGWLNVAIAGRLFITRSSSAGSEGRGLKDDRVQVSRGWITGPSEVDSLLPPVWAHGAPFFDPGPLGKGVQESLSDSREDIAEQHQGRRAFA
jgi:hypothetical protein